MIVDPIRAFTATAAPDVAEAARGTLFDPSHPDVQAVRNALEVLGTEFSLRDAVGEIRSRMADPKPGPVAVYGLCALIFVALTATHDHYLAPSGDLWFRMR